MDHELNGRSRSGRTLKGKFPWMPYHEFQPKNGDDCWRKSNEVVVMNSLTVNLHLMLTFYGRQKSAIKY